MNTYPLCLKSSPLFTDIHVVFFHWCDACNSYRTSQKDGISIIGIIKVSSFGREYHRTFATILIKQGFIKVVKSKDSRGLWMRYDSFLWFLHSYINSYINCSVCMCVCTGLFLPLCVTGQFHFSKTDCIFCLNLGEYIGCKMVALTADKVR